MVPDLAPVIYEVHTALDFLTGLVPMGPAMPHVTSTEPPGADNFSKVLGWAKWIALCVCVLGLMTAGAVMAFQARRGEGGEHLNRIGMALIGVVIISAASLVVSTLG